MDGSIAMSNEQYDKKPWSKLERNILKQYYGEIPIKSLIDKLPGRTEKSIRSQVYYLRKRGWTFNSTRR